MGRALPFCVSKCVLPRGKEAHEKTEGIGVVGGVKQVDLRHCDRSLLRRGGRSPDTHDGKIPKVYFSTDFASVRKCIAVFLSAHIL